MTAAAPSPPRTAPLALWRIAQAFLTTLHALFGAPEDVAARHTLTAKAHKQMAQWLRAGEALLRRLIAIEASASPAPAAPTRQRKPRKRAGKLMTFEAEKPEEWRVCFRMFSEDRRRLAGAAPDTDAVAAVETPRRRDAGGPKRKPPLRFRSAWPLAERCEALIRVFNDPAPYAHRLARRLHATPHRLAQALAAPPEARHRIDGFDDLTQAAETAWRQRFSSA